MDLLEEKAKIIRKHVQQKEQLEITAQRLLTDDTER